jgi:Ser/Thr protein kinase RdoA (MazF antagonist)
MQEIFEQYQWEVTECTPLHQGLINKTFVVTTTNGDFILQSINHAIFKDPYAIDQNINKIGAYLKTAAPEYLFTHLVSNKRGATLIEWEGGFYRAFHKIQGHALNVLENANQVKEAAQQFGAFTHQLAPFNAHHLKDTLIDFHNLSLRFQQFKSALMNGNSKRLTQSKNAIAFLLDKQGITNKYESFIKHPDVKKRVTHHDTKISNVLFNENEKAICVIDLDTTMAGYFMSDVGDMCRTCLCSVSEEEKDLNLIKVKADRWEGLQKGYLNHMQHELSEFEKDHFFYSGQYMIYMQALRFLTDHLQNDIYYGAHYEDHNYYRAVNQIRLLEEYESLA